MELHQPLLNWFNDHFIFKRNEGLVKPKMAEDDSAWKKIELASERMAKPVERFEFWSGKNVPMRGFHQIGLNVAPQVEHSTYGSNADCQLGL